MLLGLENKFHVQVQFLNFRFQIRNFTFWSMRAGRAGDSMVVMAGMDMVARCGMISQQHTQHKAQMHQQQSQMQHRHKTIMQLQQQNNEQMQHVRCMAVDGEHAGSTATAS